MALYYVPVEPAACEMPTTAEPRPHILGRRFALTATAYKWLDVGISVGPMSCVELVLGDNRGNRIVLPYRTWQVFLEKRASIEHLVQHESVHLNDLTVQMCANNIVRMSSNNACLFMRSSTVLFMFDLEQCVEHVYQWLYLHTREVSDKFEQFARYLRQNGITAKRDAVKLLRERIDKTSVIDCELLAYAVQAIVHEASHE